MSCALGLSRNCWPRTRRVACVLSGDGVTIYTFYLLPRGYLRLVCVAYDIVMIICSRTGVVEEKRDRLFVRTYLYRKCWFMDSRGELG